MCREDGMVFTAGYVGTFSGVGRSSLVASMSTLVGRSRDRHSHTNTYIHCQTQICAYIMFYIRHSGGPSVYVRVYIHVSVVPTREGVCDVTHREIISRRCFVCSRYDLFLLQSKNNRPKIHKQFIRIWFLLKKLNHGRYYLKG